jgi:hypothetical protein
VLTHLENVGQLLDEALKIVELTRLEIHGPEGELARDGLDRGSRRSSAGDRDSISVRSQSRPV